MLNRSKSIPIFGKSKTTKFESKMALKLMNELSPNKTLNKQQKNY